MSYRAPAFAVVLVTTLLASVAESQSPVPIAGHPPVTASGILATFDSATDILRFDDGRMVKLTGESKVVQPVANAIRAGDLIVLQNVLPIGVQSGVKTLAVGQPQRMGTIASVDESRGLLALTDGTLVHVTRSTNVHLGAAGSNVALTQVSPGDELIVVFEEGRVRVSSPDDATVAASALAREDASLPAVEAGEVMIFRVPRRP